MLYLVLGLGRRVVSVEDSYAQSLLLIKERLLDHNRI